MVETGRSKLFEESQREAEIKIREELTLEVHPKGKRRRPHGKK